MVIGTRFFFGAATITPSADCDNGMQGWYTQTMSHDRLKKNPISPERMEKAAFDYLGRYMASTETLRRVLERRVRRAATHTTTDDTGTADMIAQVIAKCRRLGLVDDQRFADTRAASLARRGDGRRAIMAKLTQKGIDPDTARAAISRLAEEIGGDMALTSAVRLAQRRRLGPFRIRDRVGFRDRDLAAMARAGHDLTVARTVIDAQGPDDLHDLLAEARDEH